jgi:hypothetical protein
MGLHIHLPDDLALVLETESRAIGKSVDELAVEALRAHFPPVVPELQKEFDAWEAASESDAMRHVEDL